MVSEETKTLVDMKKVDQSEKALSVLASILNARAVKIEQLEKKVLDMEVTIANLQDNDQRLRDGIRDISGHLESSLGCLRELIDNDNS